MVAEANGVLRVEPVHKVAKDLWVIVVPQDPLVLPELLVKRANVDKLVVMVTRVSLDLVVTKGLLVLLDPR